MLYSTIAEKLVKRGLEEMTIERIVETGKNFKKATNVHAGAYGYYEAMEKHIHAELHQNKVDFP